MSPVVLSSTMTIRSEDAMRNGATGEPCAIAPANWIDWQISVMPTKARRLQQSQSLKSLKESNGWDDSCVRAVVRSSAETASHVLWTGAPPAAPQFTSPALDEKAENGIARAFRDRFAVVRFLRRTLLLRPRLERSHSGPHPAGSQLLLEAFDSVATQ